MPAPLPIRDDLGPQEVRALARRERDGRVCRRPPPRAALAHARDGRSRAEAARPAGMGRQTLSDWVRRYDEQEGVAGLRDRPEPGPGAAVRARRGEGEQAALRALVLKGPDPARDGLSAWRRRDLCDLAAARFGRRSSATGMLAAAGQGPRPLPAGAAAGPPRGRPGAAEAL